MTEDFLKGLGDAPQSYKLYNGDVELFFDEQLHQYTTYTENGLIVVPGVTTITHIIDKSAALMQWAANMAVEHIDNHFDKMQEFGITFEELLQAAKYAHKDHKENAADIGSIAHNHIEQYIRAAIRGSHEDMKFYRETLPEHPQAANGAIAAFDWMDKHSVKWIFTEKKIYSREYNYAGTADGLAWVSTCGDRACCHRVIEWPDNEFEVIADDFEEVLAVPDWKTSNSIYPEYYYQTAAYARAFAEEYPDKYKAPYRFINRLGKDDAKFESRKRGPETLRRDDKAFLDALALYNSIESVKFQEKWDKAAFKSGIKREKEAMKAAEKTVKALEKDRMKRVKAFIKAGLSEEEAERQSRAA